MSCAWPNLNVAIVSSDGMDSFALHDHDAGYELLSQVGRPRWDDSAPRATSVYMNGSAPTALPVTVDGTVPVRVKIQGADRAAVRAAEDALWSAWKAEPMFLLDVTEDEGVGWRYRAERISYDPAPITHESLILVKQEVALTFLVQPEPIPLGGES